MKNILLLGAGKSTPYLIDYLIKNSKTYSWKITVADLSVALLEEKKQFFPSIFIEHLSGEEDSHLVNLIVSSTLVISMLPPAKHFAIAKICIQNLRSLITASYLTKEIAALQEETKNKNLTIFMEIGLDPGIDHMSALHEINNIREKGGKITSFKSYTGGLVAPESDNNPWNYKFTWNPKNVVLAGQGTVKFLQDNQFKYIPYHQLFKRIYHTNISQYGDFEGYANRDSLKYLETYQLNGIPTFIRGTFRRPGFCKAWNALVQVGMTDDSFVIENADTLTYRDFTASFLSNDENIESEFYRLSEIEKNSPEAEKIEYLGLFSSEIIKIKYGSPATILQHILEQKWKMERQDKDMIVMQHQIEYEWENKKYRTSSTLVDIGKDETFTAMAKNVGIPISIVAKLFLNGELKMNGVHLPVLKEIYIPVLKELEEWGITFKISEEEI